MSKKGRPLTGCVSREGARWRGKYTIRERQEVSRHSVMLGSINDLTKEQAKAKLREIMDRDERTAQAVEVITSADRVMELDWSSATRNCFKHSRGAVSEMIVSLDLISRGFQVYRPISPTSPCDLVVIVHEWKIFRVEVKTGKTEKSGRVFADASWNLGKFDVLAVVTEDSKVHYRAATRIQNAYYPLVENFVYTNSTSGKQEAIA